MGLTNKSTGFSSASEGIKIVKSGESDRVIALAGNPNVGKSTVFNALTNMNQHTGNWPGKTVTNARGLLVHKDTNFIMVDIPGTYSLMSLSAEEEVARDFVCFGEPDAIVVVADATSLERNLNLVLQILEANKNVIVCVNLLDEAKKKKIEIDFDELSLYLGVPVVGTSARSKEGLSKLKDEMFEMAVIGEETFPAKVKYDERVEYAVKIIEDSLTEEIKNLLNARFLSIRLLDSNQSFKNSLKEYLGFDLTKEETIRAAQDKAREYLLKNGMGEEELRDSIVSSIVKKAEEIYHASVRLGKEEYNEKDRRLDKIFTSKATGIPVMILLLGLIFWITITGANIPSAILSDFLFWIEAKLLLLFEAINAPRFLTEMLILGVYRTLAWVVSVMLPPMAIFFPLFTLLEDSGYLPRIAFNMDKFFRKANAHGKQSLTMCMGFGCNACGVIGCRIIDSPRERLIAILTNNFVPCNGRFPTLIAMITMFFVGSSSFIGSFYSAAFLTGIILLGIIMTLVVSKILSKTLLKGMPSAFALELPPYRRPQIGKVILRSVFDRTLFVLGRAVSVAAPAGLIIWLLSNVMIGDMSIFAHAASFLDPFARIIGLDGVILMAFILGFPANEIVIPLIIMAYLSTGSMLELSNLVELKALFLAQGWTTVTAVCVMLFSLMHFPCATTLLTIKKETGSIKWTFLAFIIPTLSGLLICFAVASAARLLGIA